MFFLLFFLTGCASLRKIDSEIGKFLNGEKGDKSVKSKNLKIKEQGVSDINSLNKNQKERIDLWLKTNGYNRYGDAKDTYYNGGTPLFDEASGETKERYEYIIEHHPDILSKI